MIHPGMIHHDRFWVFGYGSLMWRPGFEYVERQCGLLHGYHRAACILSIHYRGTPDVPGLVVGLDRGGACRGIAFAVTADEAAPVAKYLHEREMGTGAYFPRALPVRLDDGRRVRALAFVANRDHAQYAGKLTVEAAARLVRQGFGHTGSSRDYLAGIIDHLNDFGIADGLLHRLLTAVDHAPAGKETPETPDQRGLPAARPQ